MGTVYRKTPKGMGEIETRVHRLSPRVRSLLIMVDGKRVDDQLRELLPQQFEETLKSLLDNGFIEHAGTTGAGAPAPARAAPPPAPAPASRPLVLDIARVRKDAERALNEQVGPLAETLAIKLERARDVAELLPLLESAAQLIGNVRGAQAAAAFRLRFLGA